ncbi:MAG: type VI secretion system tube protein TssD [Bacteroidales bacterium]
MAEQYKQYCIMGFWSKLFGGGKIFDDKRNPNMACELTLCGEKYLLSEFDMQYDREAAGKEYIEMYAVIEEYLHSSIESWITAPSRKENGRIRFYSNTGALEEGAFFDIRFKGASCVRFRKCIQGAHPATTIVLTIPSIMMAGEEFEI